MDRIRIATEPADGFAVVVPTSSTEGTTRTLGISAEQTDIAALPILDVDVTEDTTTPGRLHLRVRHETDRAPNTLGAGVMPAPVLNELADELTIARAMNWIVTDYTYWRNAALPNTEGRFNRTSFGATLPGNL